MDLGIAGRTALVTGASQGIGRAIAEGLASAGADLYLVARDAARLDEAATSIRDRHGGAVRVIEADVATPAGCDRITTALEGERVDILVNNAGGTSRVPVLQLSEEDVLAVMELNLHAAIRLSGTFGARMDGWGRIVNVASIAGREPHRHTAHYGAAKAGLLSYTKSLSTELGRRGVTVNAVLPGFTLTPLTDASIRALADERGTTYDEAATVLGSLRRQAMCRMGRPEEVADVVVFLASERASWVTGTAIPVDGGTLQGVW